MKLRRARGENGYLALMHWCPGCEEVHGIKVAGPGETKWSFNENFERPTFSPSVLISSNHDGKERFPNNEVRTLCHYFITDGQIQFCGDSRHGLAGKTVDIPEWPYARGSYGGIED